MGTRCKLYIYTVNDQREFYRHWDGDPFTTGKELVELLMKEYAYRRSGGPMVSIELLEGQLPRLFEDDDGVEHGDLEYKYTIRMDENLIELKVTKMNFDKDFPTKEGKSYIMLRLIRSKDHYQPSFMQIKRFDYE